MLNHVSKTKTTYYVIILHSSETMRFMLDEMPWRIVTFLQYKNHYLFWFSFCATLFFPLIKAKVVEYQVAKMVKNWGFVWQILKQFGVISSSINPIFSKSVVGVM